MSKDNDVLDALKEQLTGYFADTDNWPAENGVVTVERNIAVPVVITAGGLIIIRDGDPGDPDQCLGQDSPVIYSHSVEIEVYTEMESASDRDAAYSLLTAAIGAAIEADKTLGGETMGCMYSRPSALTTQVDGSADIKSGVIRAIFDYQTTTPLA